MIITKIISGGQTGTDQAALDFAINTDFRVAIRLINDADNPRTLPGKR